VGNIFSRCRMIQLVVMAIFALSLFFIAPKPLVAGTESGEPIKLFNGKDLDGWDGDAKIWSVQDGAITGHAMKADGLKKNTFLIWKGGTVKDFELHAKFKIVGGNSGIQYRSKDLGEHVVAGYQADIDAQDPDQYSGILYEERARGILAERGQKVVIDAEGKKEVAGSVGDSNKILAAIKKGDWNEYVITVRGNHLVQTINGHTTVDVTDNESAKAASEGILALQVHAGFDMTVQFKDLTLTKLTAKE
jgi:hypothetical protein